MQPLVSVIVPVYKVEKYLERCVNSILNQTYKNFELILVDDGSPDKCPEMCDEYAKKDLRVKVIHKENGGVSDARNVGMDEAKGEYITFVDSDDWIFPAYINEMIRLIQNNDAQISVCRFLITKQYTQNEKKTFLFEKVFSKEEALKTMLYQIHFDTSAGGKMYLADIIKKYQFPVGKRMEELAVVYKALLDSNVVAWTNRQLYGYYQNDESLTHQEFRVELLDGIELMDKQYENIIAKYPNLKKAASSKKFSVYCYSIRVLASQGREWEDLKAKLWQYIAAYRFSMLMDLNARTKNRVAAFLSYFGEVFLR